jgi:hypothetical protein
VVHFDAPLDTDGRITRTTIGDHFTDLLTADDKDKFTDQHTAKLVVPSSGSSPPPIVPFALCPLRGEVPPILGARAQREL